MQHQNTDTKSPRRRPRLTAVILAVVAATALGWILPIGPAAATAPADSAIDTRGDGQSNTLAATRPASFADIIAAVKPAVVNISASRSTPLGPTTSRQGRRPGPGPAPGSPFDDFFRRFFDGPPGQLPPGTAPLQQASGSGFIIDANGWVVTNNHVVEGAEEITVTLDDGRQFGASVQGTDPRTDLALLELDTQSDSGHDGERKPLPYVRFGDSDAARVGDWVLAIGNPFGLGGTATVGIVSARGRDIQSGPYDDFLQIDAPINKGNSGGPLFDLNGRVIGINTAIYSPNGGSVGIGFAIPSSQASTVVDQLRGHGRVERGWLGVQVQALDIDLAEGLGIGNETGALVAEVVPDSPAARAGLRTGDVITALADDEIEEPKDLSRSIGATPPGASIELEVWRQGKRERMNVVLGNLDEESGAGAERASSPATQSNAGALGLSLSELTPTLRQRFGIDEHVEGVVVVDIVPGGSAASRGLRPGDVVTMVGQQPVTSAEQARAAIESIEEAGRGTVVLQVARGGARNFIAVPIT